jgi:hypothetical protein
MVPIMYQILWHLAEAYGKTFMNQAVSSENRNLMSLCE